MSEELLWNAGIAKTIITPEKQVWLAGFGRKREFNQILHDIWVKALVLEDRTGYRSVMVTADLQGLPGYMYQRISATLMKRLGLERSQILLTFTHNHSAPRLHDSLVNYYPEDRDQAELVKEYSDIVEDKIIETVLRAFSSLSPVRLSMGEGTTDFAVNRRNNAEKEVPERRATGKPLEGPVDHSVPVLAIHKTEGQLFAVLFGYACHPTTLRCDKLCGDYPGYAQIDLEKNHSGVTAMFFTGAGGDQNPLPRGDVTFCKQYGTELSAAVEKTLSGPLKPVPSELRTAFEFVDLDYLKYPTREELEDVVEAGASDQKRIRATWAAGQLKKMDAGEPFASSYPYPVMVWKLGGMMHWICLGGEAVVDYSLHFKKEFGPNTWVFGYASGLVAYIPSLRVWNEGGNEGGAYLYEYDHPAERWASTAEERVVNAVHRLVQRVR